MMAMAKQILHHTFMLWCTMLYENSQWYTKLFWARYFPQYLADIKIRDEKQSQVLSERLSDNDTVEWGELGQLG